MTRAEQARGAGDHARAVELATRALAIQSSPSVRMFAAEEEQAQAHFAAALGHADLCAREAQAQPDTVRNRDFVLSRCTELQTALRGRVARLTVLVAREHAAGVSITVAGRPLAAALWNEAIPVDPGSLRIEARRGEQTIVRDATASTGQSLSITVPVEELADAARHAPPALTTAETPAPTVTPPPAGAEPTRTVLPVGAFIVAGVGVAGLAVGLGALAPRGEAITTLDMRCTAANPAICPADDVSKQSITRATTWNIVANAGMIGGGALLVGGGLWLLLGRRTEQRPAVQAFVAPTPGGAMLTVGGAL